MEAALSRPAQRAPLPQSVPCFPTPHPGSLPVGRPQITSVTSIEIKQPPPPSLLCFPGLFASRCQLGEIFLLINVLTFSLVFIQLC